MRQCSIWRVGSLILPKGASSSSTTVGRRGPQSSRPLLHSSRGLLSPSGTLLGPAAGAGGEEKGEDSIGGLSDSTTGKFDGSHDDRGNGWDYHDDLLDLPLPTVSVNLPKRMILVRHAESKANVDQTEYGRTPDWRIGLTQQGHEQAQRASRRLQDLVGRDPVYFYVSPYRRTTQTLAEIKSGFDLKGQVVGEREDPRLREQDVGNFQDPERMSAIWKEREEYGRFFYRFPNGENGADVCDRVSSFLDSLFRERQVRSHPAETNVVIVGHGLMIRLFIKRWFHFTVDVFHAMKNPGNCDFVVLERKDEPFTRMELTEDSKKILNLPDDLQFGGRYGTKRVANEMTCSEL